MSIHDFSLVVAICAFLGFVASSYALIRKFRRNRLLDQQGVITNAVVKRRREIHAKYLRQEIDYEFEINGQRYERNNVHVYADTYAQLKEGDVVQIRYQLGNPVRTKLAGYADSARIDENFYVVIFFLLMTIGGFIVSLMGSTAN